jgi:hypothetical protein
MNFISGVIKMAGKHAEKRWNGTLCGGREGGALDNPCSTKYTSLVFGA